jgi:hypothetical protein
MKFSEVRNGKRHKQLQEYAVRGMRPSPSLEYRYREQLDKLLEAQESASKKIREYLDRPRWGTLFLWMDWWAQRQKRTPERP